MGRKAKNVDVLDGLEVSDDNEEFDDAEEIDDEDDYCGDEVEELDFDSNRRRAPIYDMDEEE